MKLINRFKQLSTGLKRLLIVGYIFTAIILFFGVGETIDEATDRNGITAWFIIIFGYWIIVFLTLWIYDGFKEKK